MIQLVNNLKFMSLMIIGMIIISQYHARAASIASIDTNLSQYASGQSVRINLSLDNLSGKAFKGGFLVLTCRHLDDIIYTSTSKPINLDGNATQRVTLNWTPPKTDFQGYLVQINLDDSKVRLVSSGTVGVDVSSRWTRFPRYGFISECSPASKDEADKEIGMLRDYHINGIQFYDCEYKHDQPLAGTVAQPSATWRNIANTLESRQTLLDLIDASHRDGMVAIQYNLLFGGWSDYANNGVSPTWGLWQDASHRTQFSLAMPSGWSTPAIDVFNPANPEWQKYLLSKESDMMAAYPFDGWQVDQTGDFSPAYDYSGNPVVLWQTFRPFLNIVKAALNKTIVFNNVGAYGMYDTCANSTEDAVYVECWEWAGQKTFADLKTTIDQGMSWSNGKSVILAAYMDSAYSNRYSNAAPGIFSTPGVLLTDATIFASGGAHIEIGDHNNLLDSPYFPNHNLVMSDALIDRMKAYYNFMVAYENILRGGLRSVKPNISLGSLPVSSDAAANTVWAFAKAGNGYQVVHLINLLGEDNTNWRDDNAAYPVPQAQMNIPIKYHYGGGSVTGLYFASPDNDTELPYARKYSTGSDSAGPYVSFTLPSLKYWDMFYLKVQ